MKLLLKKFAAALVIGSMGYFAGLLIGATWAGNHATNLQFAGQKGYEARGLILAIILGVLTSSFGSWIAGGKEGYLASFFGACIGGVAAWLLTLLPSPYLDPFWFSLLLLPSGAALSGKMFRRREPEDPH